MVRKVFPFYWILYKEIMKIKISLLSSWYLPNKLMEIRNIIMFYLNFIINYLIHKLTKKQNNIGPTSFYSKNNFFQLNVGKQQFLVRFKLKWWSQHYVGPELCRSQLFVNKRCGKLVQMTESEHQINVVCLLKHRNCN